MSVITPTTTATTTSTTPMNRLRTNDPTLRSLSFAAGGGTSCLKTIKDATNLGSALKQNTHIRKLDLRYVLHGASDRMKSLVIREVLSTTHPSLKCVSLSSNNFSDADAMYVAEALKTNCSLRELHLSYNQISNRGMKAIAEALNENNSNGHRLKVLHLSNNKIGGPDGARWIAQIISGGEADEEEEEQQQQEEEEEPEGGVGGEEDQHPPTTRRKKKSSILKELYISDNRLGDAGATIIAYALTKTDKCSLRVLDLGTNGIKNQGCKALASALRHSSTPTDDESSSSYSTCTLRRLCLDGNSGISKKGASELEQALQLYNNTLEEVDFGAGRRTWVSKKQRARIDQLCTANSTGKKIFDVNHLDRHNMVEELPAGVWSIALANVAAKPDIMYQTLTELLIPIITGGGVDDDDELQKSDNNRPTFVVTGDVRLPNEQGQVKPWPHDATPIIVYSKSGGEEELEGEDSEGEIEQQHQQQQQHKDPLTAAPSTTTTTTSVDTLVAKVEKKKKEKKRVKSLWWPSSYYDDDDNNIKPTIASAVVEIGQEVEDPEENVPFNVEGGVRVPDGNRIKPWPHSDLSCQQALGPFFSFW